MGSAGCCRSPPREIAQNGLDQSGQTWQNVHLAYTHGYGAVAAQVNAATTEGQPAFTLENLPPEGEPAMTQPRIYFGESDDVAFVVVGTTTDELDFSGAPESCALRGHGGIQLSNLFTRADLRVAVPRLQPAGVEQHHRREPDPDLPGHPSLGCASPCPFLGFDYDPYFAIVDGRPVWIWDAYTATDAVPVLPIGRRGDGDRRAPRRGSRTTCATR